MRVLRLCLGLVLSAMVVVVWQRREPIVEAYTEERPPVQFEFDGLDFEVGNQADLGPSPLLVPPAPDTGSAVLSSLLVSSTEPEPVVPPGTVDFAGVVSDDLGPVPFATVRVEHHGVRRTGGPPVVASVDVVADENGRWQLPNVGGGRWRIRAFVPDQLASTAPVVRFVAAGEKVGLDLMVVRPSTSLVLAVASPPSLYPDATVTIAVTVGRRRVDAEGVIIIDPVPGVGVAIRLDGASLRLISAPTASTDGNGIARFGAVCDVVGSSQGSFDVAVGTDDAATMSSALSACVAPPPPPEAPDPTPADGETVATDG